MMTAQDYTRMAALQSDTLPIVTTRFGRFSLPNLTRALGFTKGAELGVWQGDYTALFCQANPALHMLCVDPWETYPTWCDPTKNDPVLMAKAYDAAVTRLRPFHCTLLRKRAIDAAADVQDASLDFIYIDGDHSYESVTADLTSWVPKVKRGGFVSGHDYVVSKKKPYIQVVPAVQAYTQAHQIAPWFALSAERTPSFFWRVT